MPEEPQVVITGIGAVSPIGIGSQPFWNALREGRSGIRHVPSLQGTAIPIQIGGDIADFDPKLYVKPRKSLKVMCREIQTGFAAASLAVEHAALATDSLPARDRFGVIFGSDMLYCEPDELIDVYRGCVVEGAMQSERWGQQFMSQLFPLWMLKYLPNMTACHISIAHDARGTSNSIAHGDVSSLLALSEATRVIQRGHADVMIAGGSGTRLNLTPIQYRDDSNLSRRQQPPAAASRPFDADRDGLVNGEGAAAFVLERKEHAEARNARILASIRGCGNSFEPPRNGQARSGIAIVRSIQQALRESALTPAEIGHVNAHGSSTVEGDRTEAQAIRQCLGAVPVTAPKSFFGSLGAGGGAVELAVSLLAFEHDEVPITLNYQTPDPACPVNVVHGAPLRGAQRTAIVLNQSSSGQAVALVVSSE